MIWLITIIIRQKFNMKKIIKLVSILFLLFFSFILIEMISFSTKYVNRSTFNFDVNNIRNPQIKKLTRKIDNLYAYLLLKFNEKHQEHLNQEDKDFEKLTEFKTISSKKSNFTKSNFNEKNNLDEWKRSHGNHSSNRFSNLSEVNLTNVENLDLVWKYKFNEIKRDIQANPVIAEGKIFLPTTGNKIVSIDATNGKKIWEYVVNSTPARRGLVFSSNNNKSRIYFCAEKNLISLDAKNGQLIKSFGKNGIIKLKNRCKISPVIIDNLLAIATVEPALEVYNLNSGKLLWKYYLKKKSKKKRYGGKRFDYSGGNPWGGMSADINRGIVFLTTGNAGFYFNGVNRPGNNKYSNSIIAIDIFNKKKLWDFQEVKHDIWNFDIPAPPVLTSINKNGTKIDVIVAVTKIGNTIILDRLTGEPIFDFRQRKAPRSKIPGEKTAYYQPYLDLPEPFSKQIFSKEEISNISIESKNYIKNKIKNSNYGFFEPHELKKKNIFFGFHGGAEWMGASINNDNGMMYITSNNIPWIGKIHKEKNKYSYYKYYSVFERLFDENGYPGSKPPWGNLTAIDLNSGKIKWQVPFGEYENLTKLGISLTGTENYGGATATAGNLIFATGTLDKKIRAFNSINGKEVWSYQLEYVGSGPPSIYSINGEQYIVVASTGSYSLSSAYSVNFGNLLYCFKLNKK